MIAVEKSTLQNDQSAAVATPTPITGGDIRRIASCAAKDGSSRYAIQYVELSPIGLAASDGHVLCVINAPGLPERAFVEARKVRTVHKNSFLALNGQIEFVSGTGEQASRMSFPKAGADVPFQDWTQLLPRKDDLRPVATFSVDVLKRAVAALERDGDSTITIWECPETHMAMFANENGDMVLLMAIVSKTTPFQHFPSAIYESVGK